MNKIKLSCLIITLILLSGAVRGSNSDSIGLHSFNTFKMLRINNYWLETGNIAGISFNKVNSAGIVESGYSILDGEFHRMREATEKKNFYLETESYQKIKNIDFYGSFSYTNSDEKGILWNGVFDPYRGNPYIVGDSVPGATYHKETYRIQGGLAKKLNNKLTIGLLGSYFVGVGAKQKDPRPENIVMDFSVTPSIIINFSKSKLGFNAGYRNRKEEISYTQIVSEDPDPTFFTFKGFGFFSSEVDYSLDRFYTQKEYFGGFQYESKIMGMESLTEFKGSYSLETVEDGTSVIIKEDGGDWKNLNLKLKHQSGFVKNNTIHKFIIEGGFFEGDGIEYTQKVEYDEDWHAEYVTISKNLKFTRQIVSGKVNYNFLNINKNEKINWDMEAFSEFTMNTEKYHYIPEIFTSEYSSIETGVNLLKNIYLGKIHIAPEIDASYIYNISNDIVLSNDPGVTKKENKEVYFHDFEYYTTDVIKIKAGLKIGFPVSKFRNVNQFYFNTYYQKWEITGRDEDKGYITAALGIIF